MRLANEVAYAGLLEFGHAAHTRASHDPEIVFIDVSDLGEAGSSHRVPKARGRWSPAGAAIAREIVERDGTDGVGIVTPYRAQASLIGARLADGHLRGIQVGTAHRFQGREFPTVILDMVQNPGGDDWIARARRDGNDWQRTGVRIFNVGITRNADRLYIIGNQRIVRSSARGPLRHLKGLIAEEEVPVWSASELLGGVAIPNEPTEPPFPRRDVDQAMALYGDDDFYDQLRIDLDQARELIVIFSPFIAPDRLETILPQLASAVSRGVRVVTLTKDPSELLSPRLLDNLADHGIKVFTKHGRHEKVVIIDDQVSYVGSLNALSNTGKTKEVMMRFEGSAATSLITEWMRKAA